MMDTPAFFPSRARIAVLTCEPVGVLDYLSPEGGVRQGPEGARVRHVNNALISKDRSETRLLEADTETANAAVNISEGG